MLLTKVDARIKFCRPVTFGRIALRSVQKTADSLTFTIFTFTKEIVNGKIQFLRCVKGASL